MTGALCAEADPEVWFPAVGENPAQAKAICRRCPLVVECLGWALDRTELGVWGGTTEAERRRMTKAAA